MSNDEKIQEIYDICKKYGVKLNSTMFHKTPEEVRGIIEVCGLNRLTPSGTITGYFPTLDIPIFLP